MKKRNSVPFFTKVPFPYYKNANVTVGQSPNPASLIKTRSKQLSSIPIIPSIPSTPSITGKKNRDPKNSSTRRHIREKVTPESITAAPKEIHESFGSQGQILDSEMNELELIDEQ